MSVYYPLLAIQAEYLAIKHHKGQKYGDGPYTDHLRQVCCVLTHFGYTNEYIVAAWLHDIVEDTDVSLSTIEQTFGSDVSELVWAVTGIGFTRAERNLSQYIKLIQYTKGVTLKLADRIANVQACINMNNTKLGMYRKEHTTFFQLLHEYGDPQMWLFLSELLNKKKPQY
jgi:(p)ppGpp synthase/HD superfamily hydrolase